MHGSQAGKLHTNDQHWTHVCTPTHMYISLIGASCAAQGTALLWKIQPDYFRLPKGEG
jgi:hypothetical protein